MFDGQGYRSQSKITGEFTEREKHFRMHVTSLYKSTVFWKADQNRKLEWGLL